MKKQLIKEARWAIWLSLAYLVSWIAFGYFSPATTGIFGFPLWFELSCLFLPLAFTFAVYVVVQKVYRSIDLEANDYNE